MMYVRRRYQGEAKILKRSLCVSFPKLINVLLVTILLLCVVWYAICFLFASHAAGSANWAVKSVLNGVRNASQCASDISKCENAYSLEAVSSLGYELGLFPCLGYFGWSVHATQKDRSVIPGSAEEKQDTWHLAVSTLMSHQNKLQQVWADEWALPSFYRKV